MKVKLYIYMSIIIRKISINVNDTIFSNRSFILTLNISLRDLANNSLCTASCGGLTLSISLAFWLSSYDRKLVDDIFFNLFRKVGFRHCECVLEEIGQCNCVLEIGIVENWRRLFTNDIYIHPKYIYT